MSLWFWFWFPIVVVLAIKFARYVVYAPAYSKKRIDAALEWFLEPTSANASSWFGTIIVSGCLGVFYIERPVVGEWLTWLPLYPAIAAFLGFLSEMIAPEFAKWIGPTALGWIRAGLKRIFGQPDT